MVEKKTKAKKPRGRPISLPAWWLDQATAKTFGFTTQRIADIVNETAPARGDAWDRSTVGRFLKNQSPTLELMQAFCLAFELTVPVFISQTQAEALEMVRVQREHEQARRKVAPITESNPEKHARLAELDKQREALERELEGQTKALDSRDEGTKVRGRYRSVGRSRTPS